MNEKQLYELLLKAEEEETEARSRLDKFLVESDDPNDPDEFLAALNNREEKRQAVDKALKAFIDKRWGSLSKTDLAQPPDIAQENILHELPRDTSGFVFGPIATEPPLGPSQ